MLFIGDNLHLIYLRVYTSRIFVTSQTFIDIVSKAFILN